MTADVAGHDAAHGHHDDHHHHHRLRPDEWPEEELYARASAGKVGMWIFLLSDALMFAGFLLAYAVMRGSSVYWRCTELAAELVGCTGANGAAIEPILGIEFTAGLTFLLICSSVSMVFAFAAAQDNDRKGLVKWLNITILGGALPRWSVLRVLRHPRYRSRPHRSRPRFRSQWPRLTSSPRFMAVFSGVVYLSIAEGKW